jgi:putative peptidoglycan lipid II flippase
MLGRIFTVGGYTLLSRLTGFARDIMLAAILGAGPVADAFFVAFRLPNHFRAIFAEGAFNAAFVPAYAHVHGEKGEASARLFSDRVFTLLFVSQVILLVAAWFFMPQAMTVLAPGFTHDPAQRDLAIELTRITFPYLLLITLVTLYGGMLNVMHRFASAAAASIFLNLAMMATLAVAASFPTVGHAAAWGVLISGFLQYFLLAGDLARNGGLPRFAPLRLDEDIRAFFRALGPATLGSMGTQVAMFADTIIATFLPAGALSALRPSCRRARCRRSIMPTASINCRSASSALPSARCCCRKCRGGSPRAIMRARWSSSAAASTTRSCSQYPSSRPSSPCPTPSPAPCSRAAPSPRPMRPRPARRLPPMRSGSFPSC